MTELPRLENLQSKQAPTPYDPQFLFDHVQRYYRDRVDKLWNGRHPLKGAVPTVEAVQLRSNDYLCLAAHPRIIEAEIAALQAFGHGVSVSRVWMHHTGDSLAQFEERLARRMGAEAAVLVNSGYCANTGLLQSIAAPAAVVYIDQKAHISLWEGIKSASACARPFRHNDMAHLERLISQHGPGIIAVDALYSTDGAMCPLRDLIAIAERRGCVLVVDETHSFGTFGPGGGGLVSHLGVSGQVHFRTLGLSKAASSRGGAIACSARNAEYLRYEALPVIFSTQVLPHEVAGYSAVLDVLADEPARRRDLHDNHRHLRDGLDAIGFNVAASHAQIIALEAGAIAETTALRDALERRGIFGAIFFPPATAERRCLVRLTVNCSLTPVQMDRVLQACGEVWTELSAVQWASSRRKNRRAQSLAA
jgi:CAI-1 autoinducer synthase